MDPRMANTDKKIEQKKEILRKERHLTEAEKQREKELEKAAAEVGVEAGEVVEAAEAVEVPTGEVSEKEKKAKEGYAGGAAAVTAAQITGTAAIPFPSTKVMRAQVVQELKKEIKNLQKKVKRVMNQPPGKFEPHNINTLMARLRRLSETLSNLVHATGDFVKDLWIKYVRDKKVKKT